ncbi:MAG: YkgJ family cysteine cluster protein [Lentisphaeria bacterium]
MASGDGSFECSGCGTCCRWPGQVRVSAAEIDRIAAFLGLPVREFIAEWTALTSDRRGLTLGEREDGACAFLSGDNRCRLQAAKPQQCQDFPLRWNFPGWERLCQGRKAGTCRPGRPSPGGS